MSPIQLMASRYRTIHWAAYCRPALALLVAMQACTDLPGPSEPRTPVEITIDLPSGVNLEDEAWLRAQVTDPEGNRILASELAWEIDPVRKGPLEVLRVQGDSVLVRGSSAGVASVRASLEWHPFLVSDTAVGSVRVGLRGVEVSFPGIDSVFHVTSRGTARVLVQAVNNQGQSAWTLPSVEVQVRPGTALLGSVQVLYASRNDPRYLQWDSVAPGTDTVTVSFPDCLDPCANTFVARVAPVGAAIGFPQDPLTFASLGDSLRLTATIIDAQGFYVRDADPEYTFEDPADTLVLDPAALADGILVSRSNGYVRVQARDGELVGDVRVEVDQIPIRLEILDPVARYLVGSGASDTTRVELRDSRGNPLDSPARSLLFYSTYEGVAGANAIGPNLGLIWAEGLGEAEVVTRTTLWGCGSIGCGQVVIRDTVRVIPEPDSVRALPPPVNPVTALGLLPDPLLGDIHLPGETLPATELVWTTLDPSVATVDLWGRITALSNGTARFEGRMGSSADTVTLTVSAPGG